MATTGAKLPTANTTSQEDPWLDNAWTTPGNIYADDGNTASITATTYDSPDQSYVLKAYTFDFSAIPDGSLIDGVICVCNCWYANGTVSIDLMQLLDTSLAKVGTNQCATPVALGTGTGGTVTKGSSTDKWGNSLTASWIKNSNFGVALGFAATGTNSDVFVDYVSLEVYYTAAVVVAMQPASLASSVPVADAVPGAKAVLMAALSVVHAPQKLYLGMSLPMTAPQVASSAPSAEVKISTDIPMAAVSVASSCPIADAVGGPISVPVLSVSLASSAQVADAVPGVVTITAVALTVASSPQVAGILVTTAVPMSALGLTAAGQLLDVVPGAVLLGMAASGLGLSPPAFAVVPGAVSVLLAAATVAISAPTLTVDLPTGIPMTALSISATTPGAVVLPGEALVEASALSFLVSCQSLSIVPGATSVAMAAASLVLTPQALVLVSISLVGHVHVEGEYDMTVEAAGEYDLGVTLLGRL